MIANIESGRRSDITVDQMLALAWALGIPPAALVLPLDDPLGWVRMPGYEESEVPTIQAIWWFNGSNAFSDIRGASQASVIARSRLRTAEELAFSEAFFRRRTSQNAEADVIEEARIAFEKARAEAVALGMKVPDAL
ncbi:hypothetical protein EDF43_110130 [Rathayibacter sp. PhB179]|nr:hypothetical protein EDF49_110130 [Rathayibacter sp. PhB192]TCM25625.1 hypothetical protein EDF43_110130 [Rathayibacter sp. PhB179]